MDSTEITQSQSPQTRTSHASYEALELENQLLRQKLAKYQEPGHAAHSPGKLLIRLGQREQEIVALENEVSRLTHQAHLNAEERTQFLDPIWSRLYRTMKKEVEEKQRRIENYQREVLGTGFSSYSITGKKLLSKLRTLQSENEELGKQLSYGRVEQLHLEMALKNEHIARLERMLQGGMWENHSLFLSNAAVQMPMI
ncbi:hypothetical protein HDU85_007744 [Gaertneriomyces sp. JEL0708]|nr:hypothetical protein HDU85_007744 [Gaertneriomyces sp. JEL0708]